MKAISKIIWVSVFLICTVFVTHAQDREIVNELVYWFQYSGKFSLGDKYDGNVGIQYRHFADRDEDYHLFFSLGATRSLSNGISVSAGFTNLNINQRVDGKYVLVPELRPYQSVQMSVPVARSKVSWRIMTEQRFFRNAMDGELVKGYTHNWRFRMLINYQQYLSEKLDLILNTELMVNAGNINVNIFDQHRGQILLSYKLEKLSVRAGYMHWFFQTPSNRHENRHTPILILVHQF